MKKMYQYLKLSMMIVLAGVIFSCEKEKKALEVSETSFTLESAGSEGKTIKVISENAWEVDYISEGDWLFEKSKDDDSFTVGAKSNEGKQVREGSVIVKSGKDVITIHVTQNSAQTKFKRIEDYAKAECSPSGIYIAALVPEEGTVDGEAGVYYVLRENITSGEVKRLNALSEYRVIYAVGDDGSIFVGDPNTLIGHIITPDDELIDIPLPEGVKTGLVTGVSTDGRVWVGYGSNSSGPGVQNRSIKWVDKVAEFLPAPEKNAIGGPLVQGVIARGCSDDGSVIYGSEWDTAAGVYWRDGVVNYIAEESIKIVGGMYAGPIMTNERGNISPNGRYIAYSYGDVVPVEGENPLAKKYAGRFDTETGEYLVSTKENHRGGTVSNEGDLFLFELDFAGRSPIEGYVLPADSSPDGDLLTTAEWIKKTYNYELEGNEMVWHISDKGHLFGVFMSGDYYAPRLMNWYFYLGV